VAAPGPAGHGDAGREVGDAHGGVGLVDVLAAGAAGPVGVGAHIRRVDLDLDGVVDHRIDPGRGETGVPLGRRVIGADAHQPVHPRLGLQPAVGVGALDQQGGGLDAHLVAAGLLDQLHAVAVGVGPARVHAQQHVGPVAGLGAAGAGVDLDIGVVAVGLAGQQGLELGLGGAGLEGLQLRARILQRGFITLGVGHLGVFDGVGQVPLEAAHGLHAVSQLLTLTHQGLGLGGLVPQGGVFGTSVQLVQAS